jgi:phage minor structural protein
MYKIYVDGSLFCSSEIEELAIINPEIDQEVNKAGTFTFTLPPTHPYYNTIKKRTSLIDVYRDDDTEPLFEGVCIDSTIDFWKQKKLTCEGELTFLNDSNLRPAYYQNKTPRQLLESYVSQHNAQTESTKHFTVGQVTISDSNSIYCYTNYNSTMTEIKEDLVDDFGGFLRTRHVEGVRYIDYFASSPRTSNQVIRLGENLLDLSQNIDTEEIATIIIPLGATLDTQSIPGLDERLTIKTAAADSEHPSGADYVYSSTAVDAYGYIEKVVVWDDVTTVAALLAKGKAYLSDIQFENLVIQAKAIDLGLTSDEFNKFRLLDSIRVVSVPHGLDRYFILSKLQIHLNNPENDTITLGIKQITSLSAKSQAANEEIQRKIDELPTSNMVQTAIDNATALITGADGGYVVIVRNNDGQPIEIRIQDALNNPTKIWRWNQNGFGYSSDGGQTYGTAITMNGAIVADFITAGTMYADRIKGGTLKLGGASNTDGILQIVNASNQEIGHWDKDGIVLKQGTVGGWYITDSAIISYNGTNDSDSTRKVVLYKYVNADHNWSFCVYTRDSTSDAWEGKFYVTYAGFVYCTNIEFASGAVRVTDLNARDGNGITLNGGTVIWNWFTINCNTEMYGSLNASALNTRVGSGGGIYADGDIYAAGSIGCGGSKPRIVKTKSFGHVQMNAYETPTPYFGDIGEGQLDENGECLIAFDDVFKETVDTDICYQVFLQKYGKGDIWVDDRTPDYFIVKGTPELKFGFEIKAIQKDYEGVRCDAPSVEMMKLIGKMEGEIEDD